MRGLIAAALGRARMVNALLILLIVWGSVAYVQIPKESDPDINIPIVYITVAYEGISPEDAERLLIRPIEQEVQAIAGVKEMTATGYQGGANVLLEFDAGFDADKALEDVRQKVDLARPDLPAGTEEPTVNEINFSLFPVVVVSLSGEVPERTLLKLARDLEDRIQALGPVLEARIAGDREELVELVIDPMLVESYGLNAPELFQQVSRSNQLVAAGNLDTGQGRFAIKVPGLFESVQDILDMPLKISGDAVVRVRDIAEIRRHFKDPESFARIDGKRAIGIEVIKRTGENIIETIELVRATVEAEKAAWPQAVRVDYLQDRSADIRLMLGDLQNNLISGLLLLAIVCVAALGVRSSILVGVAIPGSFLTGILVLATMGLTVNVVVLFSLILVAGMLVDGAIVVVEYADRRMAEGCPPAAAYREAANRMAWPVTSSTGTTLAAFLPLLFWPGVVGEFMSYLPITLLATLIASLVVAIIFVPVLGATLGKPGSVDAATLNSLTLAEVGDPRAVGGITGVYVRILSFALNHALKVLLITAITLVAVYAAFGRYGAGVEFFPEVEPDTALVLVRARGNLSVHEKDRLVQEVETRILTLSEFDSVYTRTGGQQRGGMERLPEDTIGQITVDFRDWRVRRAADQILEDIRRRTADLPGIVVEFRKQEAGPPIGKPVAIELTSREPALLEGAVEHVLRGFAAVGGLVDIEDSRPLPGIEWQFTVDRAQAAKFGVDVAGVGEMVRLVTNGLKLASFRPDDADDEIDIVARYPQDDRTLDRLDEIRVHTSQGLIPIGNFVRREARPKVSEVHRVGGAREMTVAADVPPGTLADNKIQAMRAWLAANPLNPLVRADFKGQDEEQRESSVFLMQAFGVSLFLIAVILITQFNRFFSTVLVLSAVILSTIGVMLGLLITHQPFGIVMSGIGVIALAGVVVNNNIILIDTYDHLRRDGMAAVEAALRTGAQRLRPIYLTAVTTVLGLVPMATQFNIDFIAREVTYGAPSTQWWVQLSSVIAFGLTFATILTLVVTPCALVAWARFETWRRRPAVVKTEVEVV